MSTVTAEPTRKKKLSRFAYDPEAIRAALLAAIDRAGRRVTRVELVEACKGFASDTSVYLHLAELIRAGMVFRKREVFGRSREYRHALTPLGRNRLRKGDPAAIFRDIGEKNRRAAAGGFREQVRAAVVELIDQDTYPSGDRIACLVGSRHPLRCGRFRDELEADGQVPPREEWPGRAGLPLHKPEHFKRIWRRAAIVRAANEGLPRPHGNQWRMPT